MGNLAIVVAVVLVAAVAITIRAALKCDVRMFERYQHHSKKLVWVRKDLKGLHKDFCLCFDCKRFHPGSKANCPVAKTLYRLCVDHDLVTPVWECPRFLQDPFALIS